MTTANLIVLVIYLVCAVSFGFLAASYTLDDLKDYDGKVDLEACAMAICVFFIAGAVWWMIAPIVVFAYLLKLLANREKMK